MTRARPARAEALRVLHRYRRLVLLGRVSLPLEAARRIVGPDCAYHLYFRHAGPGAVVSTSGRRSAAKRRRRMGRRSARRRRR